MPSGFADVDAVRAALVDADYPATKDELVQYAVTAGADEPTLRALRAMPPVDYRNLDEVLRSADLDPAAREGQTDHDKAAQARVEARPGVAEHLRDVSAGRG